MFRVSLLLHTQYILPLIANIFLVLVLMCLSISAIFPSPQHVYLSLVFGHKYCAYRSTFSLPLLLSLRDLMRHRHTCKLRPAGLLLILGPPCERTLSLSLPIILEHYWLLICPSALPQISNVITKWTNNPLCSYLVVTASNTLFI